MSDFSQKLSMKPLLKIALPVLLVLVVGLPSTSEVYAGSCAYGEAMMALEKGNTVRGLALMRMASRDGDRRAENYLREQDYDVAELPAFVKGQRLLSLASSTSRH